MRRDRRGRFFEEVCSLDVSISLLLKALIAIVPVDRLM
jgi:hypothetical protein